MGNEYGLLLHIYTALLSIYWAVMHYTLTQEGCIYQWREDDDDVTDMGWLRLVGSSKFQVSFAEYSLFYRALVQKRPIILRSLLIVATPYVLLICHIRTNHCYVFASMSAVIGAYVTCDMRAVIGARVT